MPDEATSIADRISAIISPASVSETEEAHEEPSGPEPREKEPAAVEEAAEAAAEGAAEEASSEEEEVVEIGDIGDLAAHLNVDASELYNIAIPYTKDGERQEFTLGQIKDQLQDWQDTLAQREQISSTLQRYQQSTAQVTQLIDEQAEFVTETIKEAHSALLRDMQQINWDELHRTNPGEWARQSEMYRRKGQELQSIHTNAMQTLHAKREQAAQHQLGLQRETLQREQRETLRAIPEWRDNKVADAEKPALVEYMREKGYTDSEINALTDHRQLVLARNAWKYEQMQKAGQVAAKKVAHLPKKIVKPGAAKSSVDAQQNREREAVKAHRANPKSREAAAARIRLRLGR